MFCKGKIDTWNFANRIFAVPNMRCVSNISNTWWPTNSPRGAFVCAVWALGPGLCDAMSRQVVAGTPSQSMLGTKNSWPENLWNGVFFLKLIQTITQNTVLEWSGVGTCWKPTFCIAVWLPGFLLSNCQKVTEHTWKYHWKTEASLWANKLYMVVFQQASKPCCIPGWYNSGQSIIIH